MHMSLQTYFTNIFLFILAMCGTIIKHYSDVIMSAMAFQITGVSIVCSAICSGGDQRKHQSSLSLAFVMGFHRWPHNGPVTRKMLPFDDVIMGHAQSTLLPTKRLPPYFRNLEESMITHWGWDKMAAIVQKTFSNALSWIKMNELRLKFHWFFFQRVQLVISQHCFR